MELVLFAVELGEEAADAGEGAVAASSMKRCCAGVRSYQGTSVGMPAALAARFISPWWARYLVVVQGCDGAFVEGLGVVGDDEVGVEVDGVAEALAARAGAVGIVEGEEAGLGLAVGAMAGGALEGGGEAELRGVLRSSAAGQQYGTGFRRIRGSRFRWRRRGGCGFGAEGEAVDEDEDGLARSRARGGTRGWRTRRCCRAGCVAWCSLLVEAVVAAAAELGEALLEGVGEGRRRRCSVAASGFLCGRFSAS